jgi:triosephosphate isomerase
MRRPFVAGNWKMHNDLAAGLALVRGLRAKLPGDAPVDVAVCPPATLLHPIHEVLKGSSVLLGAQNCYFEPKGAFTGELAPGMLKDVGCTFVILGHSERRHIFGESGEMLARKVVAAQEAGLHVIYCVGETLEERDAHATEAVVDRQLSESITANTEPALLTIAYEPVWAIGTGRTATTEQAQPIHAFIRSRLAEIIGPQAAAAMRIQYGGSVKPANAAELFACPDIDGGLVGGACLDATDFAAIISAAEAAAANGA